jgi:hypothetical protein
MGMKFIRLYLNIKNKYWREMNANLRDRFTIYKYPSFVYFAENNRMYFYEGLFSKRDFE